MAVYKEVVLPDIGSSELTFITELNGFLLCFGTDGLILYLDLNNKQLGWKKKIVEYQLTPYAWDKSFQQGFENKLYVISTKYYYAI